jgi:hypothetical protein
MNSSFNHPPYSNAKHNIQATTKNIKLINLELSKLNSLEKTILMKKLILIINSTFLSFSLSLFAENFSPCHLDKKKQMLRSKELAEIACLDQESRKNFPNMSQENLNKMLRDDTKRRMRVGEIFGEGCFSSAKDYAAAALVFQHGIIADHFFQAFLWAKKSVDLGDEKQMRLMALSLDRYLVTSGYKQLFGSQAIKLNSEKCWCLQQTEKTFPEKLRQKYMGNNLNKQVVWLKNLNIGQSCPNIFCSNNLKEAPKGTIPGFW